MEEVASGDFEIMTRAVERIDVNRECYHYLGIWFNRTSRVYPHRISNQRFGGLLTMRTAENENTKKSRYRAPGTLEIKSGC